MTLTEALAPYTIKGAGGDLPITSDRVQVEYDVTGGTKRLRHVVVQVGGDKFLRIDSIPEGSGQQMWLEFKGGGDNFHLMLEVTPQLAHDIAVSLAREVGTLVVHHLERSRGCAAANSHFASLIHWVRSGKGLPDITTEGNDHASEIMAGRTVHGRCVGRLRDEPSIR